VEQSLSVRVCILLFEHLCSPREQIATLSAPAEVNLIYRNVGKTHVFTALELPGFHIGSSMLNHVFDHALSALNEHVSKLYLCEATYKLDYSFDGFLAQIESHTGPVVTARRSSTEQASVQH
jgi:hypothetical protein